MQSILYKSFYITTVFRVLSQEFHVERWKDGIFLQMTENCLLFMLSQKPLHRVSLV